MPRTLIEAEGLSPREKVGRLVEHLGPLQSTIQYSWLMELSRVLFDFDAAALTVDNWETLFDRSAALMAKPGWADEVLRKSHLEAVFLTNDFDDPLEGFDTRTYIPCLRTDDLVFHLATERVRQRLESAARCALTDRGKLHTAIGQRFEHFVAHGARACAISLPPDFVPRRIGTAAAERAVEQLLQQGDQADATTRETVACDVFWMLAEFCAELQLPFDLMIGVNRSVYQQGVYQGQDLFDSRVSLIQYQQLFNAFPQVVFPVSVLASVTNQELVSYAWIFPNVVTHGHWWYSNIPSFIERDLAARLEGVPQTKQIGYYSDMYKLEFAQPKFAMYKRVLAKVLAERLMIDRGWSETDAVTLGHQILRGNVERVFRVGGEGSATT
jgi:glucuronate isomerase